MRTAPDLTTHLVALAGLLGYDIDLDELEPVTGLHTEQVIAWAEAGSRHAAIAYTRALLTGPISFLRVNPSPAPAGQHLLASLLDHHQRYDEALDHASRQYAEACHALTHTALVWPRVPDQHRPGNGTADQPPAHTTTPPPPLRTTGQSAAAAADPVTTDPAGQAATDPYHHQRTLH